MLSKRIEKLEESGIRKIFNQAGSKKDLLNLSIGQAHFNTPKILQKSAQEAMRLGANGYTSTLGLLELREKIANKLKKENNIKAGIDNIIMTSGVSGGINLALSVLLDEGDEVILPDPYFVI